MTAQEKLARRRLGGLEPGQAPGNVSEAVSAGCCGLWGIGRERSRTPVFSLPLHGRPRCERCTEYPDFSDQVGSGGAARRWRGRLRRASPGKLPVTAGKVVIWPQRPMSGAVKAPHRPRTSALGCTPQRRRTRRTAQKRFQVPATPCGKTITTMTKSTPRNKSHSSETW